MNGLAPTLLVIVTVALVIAVILYLSLRARMQALQSQMESWVQHEMSIWRDREVEAIRNELREQAIRETQIQHQQWREHELEQVRSQQLEVARKEALVLLEQWKTEQEQMIRRDAIQRSQAVTVGKVSEHFVPYLPGFKYNPKDARFIGSPIDFVIFDGLNEDDLRGVVFV